MNRLDYITEKVPRLFTDRHAKLMYGLIRWMNIRSAVEVGAFHGYCSLHITEAIKENGGGKLTVIDDFSLQSDAAAIHNNFARAGLADILEIRAGKSTEVEWPRAEFAFIDGDHSLDGCLHDCNQAISNGAKVVCIHDTVGWWGPRDYVEEFRKQSEGTWDVIEGNFDSGFAVMVYREPKPPVQYSKADFPSGAV
jgi:predicted O-methyltransferase YrrM